MEGAEKYNDVCTMVRETTEADGAVVMIFGGNRGSGFEIQVTDEKILYAIPATLEMMAKHNRADLANKMKGH